MRPSREHAVLVGSVIIVAEDAVLLEAIVKEEVIFLLRHPVFQQIFVHAAVDPAAVIEVEAEEAARVHMLGVVDRLGLSAWKYSEDSDWMKMASARRLRMASIARTLALTMCLSAVTKLSVGLHLLVPPAIFGREGRANEHLVHRRVELHPRVALGKGGGIAFEQDREIRVLEIADPVGNTEMAKVDDRRDVASPELGKGDVRRIPSHTCPGAR